MYSVPSATPTLKRKALAPSGICRLFSIAGCFLIRIFRFVARRPESGPRQHRCPGRFEEFGGIRADIAVAKDRAACHQKLGTGFHHVTHGL